MRLDLIRFFSRPRKDETNQLIGVECNQILHKKVQSFNGSVGISSTERLFISEDSKKIIIRF